MRVRSIRKLKALFNQVPLHYYLHTSSNEAQDAAFGPPCPPILGGPEFQSPPKLGDLGGHREHVLQSKDLCSPTLRETAPRLAPFTPLPAPLALPHLTAPGKSESRGSDQPLRCSVDSRGGCRVVQPETHNY
jgi:hypothetical protein